MNEPTSPAEEAKPHSKGFLMRVAEVWQWLIALAVGLFATSLRTSWRELQAPDAPVIMFWSTIVIGLVLAASLAPPVFFRIPRGAKAAAYVGIAGYFMLFISTFGAIQIAWERTPQGAAEAKQTDILLQGQAENEREWKRLNAQMAEAQKRQQQTDDQAAKLEVCYPGLQESVRNGLHNPHAFEHVETVAIEPDLSRNNVAMTFRAENAFGALRTWVIKASIDPNSCDIAAMGDPEQM